MYRWNKRQFGQYYHWSHSLPNTIEPHCLILFHEGNSVDTKQEAAENKTNKKQKQTIKTYA
jgi:hypothetical protein